MLDTSYLREVENASWVQETIMERFDNALEFMTPYTIIYGGAIRDCIAKKELMGDLDFAVSKDDFCIISEAFSTNPKWIPFNHISSDGIKNSGDLAKKLSPMSSVSSFKTTGDKVIQLITSKYQDRDDLQNSIYVARMVDIVCCGVIMLYDGRVFEAVPGAYQDCVDGVLNINTNSDSIYIESLRLRVEKLVSRGWKNMINVDKVIKNIEIRREKEKKRAQRLIDEKNNKSGICNTGIEEYHFYGNGTELKSTLGGRSQEISKTTIDTYFNGSFQNCLKFLETVSYQDSIYIRAKYTPIKNIYYETINNECMSKVKRRVEVYCLKRLQKENKELNLKNKKDKSVICNAGTELKPTVLDEEVATNRLKIYLEDLQNQPVKQKNKSEIIYYTSSDEESKYVAYQHYIGTNYITSSS